MWFARWWGFSYIVNVNTKSWPLLFLWGGGSDILYFSSISSASLSFSFFFPPLSPPIIQQPGPPRSYPQASVAHLANNSRVLNYLSNHTPWPPFRPRRPAPLASYTAKPKQAGRSSIRIISPPQRNQQSQEISSAHNLHVLFFLFSSLHRTPLLPTAIPPMTYPTNPSTSGRSGGLTSSGAAAGEDILRNGKCGWNGNMMGCGYTSKGGMERTGVRWSKERRVTRSA